MIEKLQTLKQRSPAWFHQYAHKEPLSQSALTFIQQREARDVLL